MIALLITGVAVFCAGILVVIYGMPIKEFSFGHTLIVAGAIVACTGLLLMGLYFIGRELRMSRRLEAGQKTGTKKAATDRTPVRDALTATPGDRARNVPEPPQTSPPTWLSAGEDFLFPNNQSPDHADDMTNDLAPSTSKGWQDHEHTRPPWLADAPSDATPRVTEKPRRSFLFSSRRRETPSSQGSQEDHSTAALPSFETDPEDNFASTWSNSERERDRSFSRNNRSTEGAGRDTSAAGLERYRSPRQTEAKPVAIVKSGVVDSMAYSLYSDGSIEAQMPEGLVRFASVDELRAHLDHRG